MYYDILGELKSTPLVNAIHEKLKNDKEKQIQEREERARARRKEQDRLRNLRKVNFYFGIWIQTSNLVLPCFDGIDSFSFPACFDLD